MSRSGGASLLLAALLLGSSGGVPSARAQNASDVVTSIALATIDTPPFTGAGARGLDFGTLLPGVTSDVPPGPATPSAQWQFLNVKKNRDVQATFDLPPVLALGTATIPVNWNNANYGYVCLLDDTSLCVQQLFFNPAQNGGVVNFSTPKKSGGPSFDVDVFLGGKATAAAGLPAGTYTALVTLTLLYVN